MLGASAMEPGAGWVTSITQNHRLIFFSQTNAIADHTMVPTTHFQVELQRDVCHVLEVTVGTSLTSYRT